MGGKGRERGNSLEVGGKERKRDTPSEREARGRERSNFPKEGGKRKSGKPGKYSLRHGTEASFGCRGTSLEEGGKKGECGNSFRPFGAPPSKREARE